MIVGRGIPCIVVFAVFTVEPVEKVETVEINRKV